MEIVDKNKCTGCYSCVNICPKNCITMISIDGFLHPVIDESLCIKCNLCINTCPVRNPIPLNPEKKIPDAYGAYSNDEEILLKSSSGGLFSVIAEYVLSKNGVVFGAGFNASQKVVHMSVHKKEDLYKLRQSKYVQSEIGDTFKQAKELLNKGILVFFTGTSCQIVGLKKFLKKDYNNLLTQDLICHGVPSPEKFKNYISQKEKLKGGKLTAISFRNKDRKRWSGDVVMSFNNNTIYKKSCRRNSFFKEMLRNKNTRPSCKTCLYRSMNRHSDITLADFWGVSLLKPSIHNRLGTSLVIIHSKKGEKVFKEITPYITSKKVKLKLALIFNPSMKRK